MAEVGTRHDNEMIGVTPFDMRCIEAYWRNDQGAFAAYVEMFEASECLGKALGNTTMEEVMYRHVKREEMTMLRNWFENKN